MSAALQIVTPPFSRTSPYIGLAFSFLLIVDILMFSILNRGHTAFEFGKPFKNSCLPIVWSLKTFQKFLYHFCQV